MELESEKARQQVWDAVQAVLPLEAYESLVFEGSVADSLFAAFGRSL